MFLIEILGDSGSGFYIDVRSSWKILGIVSSATVQECGSNDFVLFTSVPKFTDWIQSEISANDNEELEYVFNDVDETPNELQSPNERKKVVTECKYQDIGLVAFNVFNFVVHFQYNNIIFFYSVQHIPATLAT